jgi:CRP-like cAMP-binding protein
VALVALLSRRLRDSDRRLVQFATSDTLGRVAARLVQLCDEHGSVDDEGDIHIELPLTQEDLAGWTGASLEATARALRQMRDLQWVTTGRRSITVRDVDALRRRAG